MTTVAEARGRLPIDWQPRRHVIGGRRPASAGNVAYPLTVPGMNKPPGRYDVTVRVARDDGHPPTRRPSRSQPAGQRRAGTQASSARTRPRRSSALSALPRQTGPRRLPSPWPSWPTRSRLGIRSRHPAGERPVPAVVRRFEEHRLPELVVAAVAGDPDVSHAAAAPGSLPGRLAEARRPAHLRLAGPQLVTERAAFRLVLEQRSGHLNDHALTSRHRVNDRRNEHGMIVTRNSSPSSHQLGTI